MHLKRMSRRTGSTIPFNGVTYGLMVFLLVSFGALSLNEASIVRSLVLGLAAAVPTGLTVHAVQFVARRITNDRKPPRR